MPNPAWGVPIELVFRRRILMEKAGTRSICPQHRPLVWADRCRTTRSPYFAKVIQSCRLSLASGLVSRHCKRRAIASTKIQQSVSSSSVWRADSCRKLGLTWKWPCEALHTPQLRNREKVFVIVRDRTDDCDVQSPGARTDDALLPRDRSNSKLPG